jgi:hypothetical protein
MATANGNHYCFEEIAAEIKVFLGIFYSLNRFCMIDPKAGYGTQRDGMIQVAVGSAILRPNFVANLTDLGTCPSWMGSGTRNILLPAGRDGGVSAFCAMSGDNPIVLFQGEFLGVLCLLVNHVRVH